MIGKGFPIFTRIWCMHFRVLSNFLRAFIRVTNKIKSNNFTLTRGLLSISRYHYHMKCYSTMNFINMPQKYVMIIVSENHLKMPCWRRMVFGTKLNYVFSCACKKILFNARTSHWTLKSLLEASQEGKPKYIVVLIKEVSIENVHTIFFIITTFQKCFW